MNTKGKRLATILGLSSVVLATGVGVYAAKNDAQMEGALDKNRPQMEMRQIGSGEMMKHPGMEGFNPENFDPENMSQREGEGEGKGNRFGFAFIDEKNLTDEQKADIEKLQEERDEAIKKINDEFFDKLEKFISDEKLEDYENFVENHENMKGGIPQQRGEHKMKGDCPMKNIQKPKETNEE